MRAAVKKECLPKETPEKKISSEIQGLSASEIEKIIKMVHLLKAEFFGEKKKASIESFRKAKGAWGDIDIAIFLNKDDIDGFLEDAQFMKLTRKIDSRIEPHSFARLDFKTDPFVREIVTKGKRIA